MFWIIIIYIELLEGIKNVRKFAKLNFTFNVCFTFKRSSEEILCYRILCAVSVVIAICVLIFCIGYSIIFPELRQYLLVAIILITGNILLQICDLICIDSLYKRFEEEAFPSLVDSRNLSVTYQSTTPSHQLTCANRIELQDN